MFETEAFKALGAFPLVQGALAILIAVGGLYALLRGTKDKNGSGQGAMPQWLLMGPAHDAMGALHDVNEQIRRNGDLLERIETNTSQSAETLRAIMETARHNAAVLEMIRNESRLR